MKEAMVTGYILSCGKLTEIKIPKKESLRDKRRQLEKDKECLEIMSKMQDKGSISSVIDLAYLYNYIYHLKINKD